MGIPLGVWSAIRRNSVPDYAIRLASLLACPFPLRLGHPLLLAFAITLRWIPGDEYRGAAIRSGRG